MQYDARHNCPSARTTRFMLFLHTHSFTSYSVVVLWSSWQPLAYCVFMYACFSYGRGELHLQAYCCIACGLNILRMTLHISVRLSDWLTVSLSLHLFLSLCPLLFSSLLFSSLLSSPLLFSSLLFSLSLSLSWFIYFSTYLHLSFFLLRQISTGLCQMTSLYPHQLMVLFVSGTVILVLAYVVYH